ncbi:MAG: ABC transporter ATP-binding protein [Rhodospirillales bacterium]|nr:ABC transporter ATP-binding protein [Rhodospirillales bacterium]
MSALLEARGLIKRFGGLVASAGLSLDIAEGEVHALIGPNGAGKTTAIGQLAGEMRPDAGSIRFAGQEITRLPVQRRTRLGLTRSFQVTSIFPHFTAVENVMTVLLVRSGRVFRFFAAARRETTLREEARAMLARVGLEARGDVVAEDLAHGEQRLLELAMALATGARLLLLDEPMAGLGPLESQAMTRTLGGLKGRVTMLLVEHDMQAVFALADRVSVLVSGKVIASGEPAAIRADPLVREAYLGEDS